MSVRDPHRFSHQLDPETLDRLISRLESRGQDEVFSRLLVQYLQGLDLSNATRVLEVGCGTGVVTRAIAEATRAEDGDFSIAGIDQSPDFIEVARAKADDPRLTYQVGDAHHLPFPDRHFDVVIAHTVISHVTDPIGVLHQMGRVLRPGGKAILFDGDYASLTFSHPDEKLAETMNRALATATFNNPIVMRTLPRALEGAGMELEQSLANVVSEIGTASYFRSFIETYAPMVAKSGLVPESTVNQWLDDQRAAMDDGTFFASCNYYTIVAKTKGEATIPRAVQTQSMQSGAPSLSQSGPVG